MARRRSDEPGRRGYRWRPTKHLELRQRFLIVCEGGKTEPNYFRAFKVPIDVVSVEVVGLGLDPLNLIKEAVARKGKAAANGNPYDQVWCVFDRDSWTLQAFNQAIETAKAKGIRIAYSNEAFELWYLLHFDYHNTAISRSTYRDRLSNKLGRPYRKNDPEVYGALVDKQDQAIKFAAMLLSQYEPPNPAQDNPSTTVHLLVQELNKHARP